MNSTHELAQSILDALVQSDLDVYALKPSIRNQHLALIERAIREHYSSRLRATRDAKRATGARVEGQKPYGTLAHEQEIIQGMRELRAAGQSYDAIARELNHRGLKTRHNAKWHASTVSKILGATLEATRH